MQMSPFEFISVFASLIVGFTLAHILRATSDLYEIRKRVKTYWLNSLWVVTVTMWSVFAWWGLWQLSIDLNDWNYAQYWLLVTNLASIYFFTTLVLPKATDSGEIDLEKHYYSVHQAFFSIVAFSLFTSSAMNYFLFKLPMMAVPPFIVGCAAVVASFTESRNYHKFIGIFMFIMFIGFQLSDITEISYVP